MISDLSEMLNAMLTQDNLPPELATAKPWPSARGSEAIVVGAVGVLRGLDGGRTRDRTLDLSRVKGTLSR
jgi:hypothetical protein